MSQASERAEGIPTGLPRRLGAWAYDLLLIVIGVWGTTLLVLVIAVGEVTHPALFGFLMLEYAGFYAYFWRRQGQTLGMRAWRIHVVDAEGQRPSWRQIAVRLLVAPLSLACFGIGYLWCYTSPSRQTWHDRASGTYVVHVSRG